MIKGETVTIVWKMQTGEDPLGAPIYKPIYEDVHDVIVGTTVASPNVDSLDLDGGRRGFTLGIPKSDNHDWENVDVIVRGELYRSYGRPLIQTPENVPGKWNAQVTVERYE